MISLYISYGLRTNWSELIWTDTRDMTADGHTKGSIKRTALHALMSGETHIQYDRGILELFDQAEIHQHSERNRQLP